MTQESRTQQAAAVQRGDDPTLAPDAAELTAAELALVVGGEEGGPGSPGDKTGIR